MKNPIKTVLYTDFSAFAGDIVVLPAVLVPFPANGVDYQVREFSCLN